MTFHTCHIHSWPNHILIILQLSLRVHIWSWPGIQNVHMLIRPHSSHSNGLVGPSLLFYRMSIWWYAHIPHIPMVWEDHPYTHPQHKRSGPTCISNWRTYDLKAGTLPPVVDLVFHPLTSSPIFIGLHPPTQVVVDLRPYSLCPLSITKQHQRSQGHRYSPVFASKTFNMFGQQVHTCISCRNYHTYITPFTFL